MTNGMKSLELPAQNAVLQSAFTGRYQQVRKQAMIEVLSGSVRIDQIFLISSKLITSILLGVDFCKENGVILNFPERKLLINARNNGESVEVTFFGEGVTEQEFGDKEVSKTSYIGQEPERTLRPLTNNLETAVNQLNPLPRLYSEGQRHTNYRSSKPEVAKTLGLEDDHYTSSSFCMLEANGSFISGEYSHESRACRYSKFASDRHSNGQCFADIRCDHEGRNGLRLQTEQANYVNREAEFFNPTANRCK
jgi:hypothetical protein